MQSAVGETGARPARLVQSADSFDEVGDFDPVLPAGLFGDGSA
jgi:hypothetical protein